MFVLNAIVISLSHGEVPSHRPSVFPSISQELDRNADKVLRQVNVGAENYGEP